MAVANIGTMLTAIPGAIPGFGVAPRLILGALSEAAEEVGQESVNRIVKGEPLEWDKEYGLSLLAGAGFGGATNVILGAGTDIAAEKIREDLGAQTCRFQKQLPYWKQQQLLP